MDDLFKVGDVVLLKSGGPVMTIIEIRSDGYLAARWFTSEAELKYDAFDPKELIKVCRHEI